MKTLIAFLPFLLNVPFLKAQERNLSQLYLSNEVLINERSGIELKAVLSKDYTFQYHLGYSLRRKVSLGRPDGFRQGGILSPEPLDELSSIELGISRILELNRKGTIRLNLSVSGGVGFLTELTNWQDAGNPGCFCFTPTHTYDEVKSTTVGVFLSPKLEIPVAKHFGFVFGPGFVANTKYSTTEFRAGILVGILR